MLRRARLRARRPILYYSLLAVAGLFAVFALFSFYLLIDGWTDFGTSPKGERLARMERSPNFVDGVFVNPQPMWNDMLGWLTTEVSPYRSPTGPLPVVTDTAARLATPPATGLRVTWLGHSTLFLEIDGKRVLVDPVWSEVAGPFTYLGPVRFYAPPIALTDLPPPDAVIISHDHYDHLDTDTILAMRTWDVQFFTPLGVGAHLEYWGIAPERITELDWWEEADVGPLRVACVPARHASGRYSPMSNGTLWGGWVLAGPGHRIYYSGDTGMFPAMKEIGARYGPFDATMIEVGAYGWSWPDWHIGPEQAVAAHLLVEGGLFFPVHWGLFNLAMHGWTAPAERVVAAAEASGARFVVPRPGEPVEPANPPAFERWWPDVPWKTAAEDPIVSTKLEGM